MKKSMLKVTFVLLVFALALTACGSNHTTQPAETTQDSAAEVGSELNPHIPHNAVSFQADSAVFVEAVNKHIDVQKRRLEKPENLGIQQDGESFYRIPIADNIEIELKSLSADDNVISYTVVMKNIDLAGREDWQMFHDYLDFGIQVVVQPHTQAKGVMQQIGMEPDKDYRAVNEDRTYQEGGIIYFLNQYDPETKEMRCGFKIAA